jgi:hypothetical protein
MGDKSARFRYDTGTISFHGVVKILSVLEASQQNVRRFSFVSVT